LKLKQAEEYPTLTHWFGQDCSNAHCTVIWHLDLKSFECQYDLGLLEHKSFPMPMGGMAAMTNDMKAVLHIYNALKFHHFTVLWTMTSHY
jgi:hypothetical protein